MDEANGVGIPTGLWQPNSPHSLERGFDLGCTVEDTAQFASEGWTVIDDDEAMVVATERQNYSRCLSSVIARPNPHSFISGLIGMSRYAGPQQQHHENNSREQ
jgi:hypothetical protein